jgi:hypothetical protein
MLLTLSIGQFFALLTLLPVYFLCAAVPVCLLPCRVSLGGAGGFHEPEVDPPEGQAVRDIKVSPNYTLSQHCDCEPLQQPCNTCGTRLVDSHWVMCWWCMLKVHQQRVESSRPVINLRAAKQGNRRGLLM